MKSNLFSFSSGILALGVAIVLPVTVRAEEKKAAAPVPAAEEAVKKSVVLPDPVATVNGVKITKAEVQKAIDAALANAGISADALPYEQQLRGYHGIVRDMIIEKLLDEKTKDVKVTPEEVNKAFTEVQANFPDAAAFKKQLADAGETEESVKKSIASGLQKQKWLEEQTKDKVALAPDEARKFFDGNTENFKQPEQVRASHILIRSEKDAKPEDDAAKKKQIEAVAARLKKGEDFATVAKEVSEDPGSKESGGDLNYFERGRMDPEFAEAAFKLDKDGVSEIVRTQFGYHIIKVTDKKAARDIPFDEVKEKIGQYLVEQRRRTAVGEQIDALQKSAKVEVFLAPLPEPAPAPVAPAPEPAAK